VLTFDDGYQSFLPVAELLATRGMQATFFLTRDLCQQRSDFLRDPEIRRLGELGEVGTHGTSHARLSHLPPAAASQELVESRQWLEDLLGREVRFMSVPGGFWSPSRQRLAIQAGYTLVGNSREWWNRAQLVRRWRQVNRVALRSHFSPVQFDRILRRDLRFYIPRWLRFLALAIPKSLWLRAVGPESALSRPR
jgi:peptidoglycan/xylan/chitin deacetylase (PgdA/CDA1 family)